MLWFSFILGLNYIFFCFWVIMYDNELKTKENIIRIKDNIEP